MPRSRSVFGSSESSLLRISKDEVVHDLSSWLLPVIAAVGFILAVLSVVQTVKSGWNMNYSMDVFVYLTAVTLLVLRRHLSSRGVIVGLMIIGTIDGTINLFAGGLAGPFVLSFTAVVMLAGIFFGLRAAVISLLLSISLIGLVGSFYVTGLIDTPQHVAVIQKTAMAWMGRISTFLLYVSCFILLIRAIQNRLNISLHDLAGRTEQLETAVQKLKDEIVSRQKTEQLLRAEEQRYRSLAENMQDTVFIQNLDFSVTYVSKSVQTMLGYTVDEALTIGKNLALYLTPESVKLVQASFEWCFAVASSGQNPEIPLMELEYIRKDGTKFWGELKVAFLFDAEGKPAGTQGIIRNISTRKESERVRRDMEERLSQSEKLEAVGLLAGGIAHDFNNQLAGIQGNAELIRRNKDLPSDVNSYISNILSSVKNSSELISKLLTFSRRSQHQNAIVNLHAIIDETVEILKHSIPKTIVISCRYKATRHELTGDYVSLQNAMLNLGINARDAMRNGGTLTFESENVSFANKTPALNPGSLANGDYLLLRVRDTGTGMDAKTVSRIFEPFFTTKEIGKGTGMGLSLVYATVKNHKGAIEVQSESGNGSVFCMYFPLFQSNLAPQESISANASVQISGLNILVIEDEQNVANMLVRLLKTSGHNVFRCEDGSDALKYLANHAAETDLILMDMIMPKLTGVATFNGIRAIDPSASVIVMSGYSSDGDVSALINAGAAGYLKKPFTISELESAIATAIDGGRRRFKPV
jgi:PAS domain S-box-containing protein